TEGQRLGYRRFDGKNEVLVLFNLEGSECSVELPESGKFTDLLENKQHDGKSVKVGALSAVVLKKN
ncbi:MAG: alpha-glucosidase C-terminal domain-containing protein, partial [Chitinophagaceae bacterium]|nr:alpha-glucosidase C-terminal domain-containing protein [Chitinophagaceae bacterium]